MTIEFKAPEVGPNADALTSLTRGRGPRRGNLEDLLKYWRPIMKKPGGFRRCVVTLMDKPQFGGRPQRICAWLHHELTGKWPNEGKGKKGKRSGNKRRGRSVTRRVRAAAKKSDYGISHLTEGSTLRSIIRDSREFGGILVQPINGRQNAVDMKAALFAKYSERYEMFSTGEIKRVGVFGSSSGLGQAAQAAGSILLPGDLSDIRSPIRSQIYETLTPGGGSGFRTPSARRLIRGAGRGARNKFRCPPGFEKGGTFTNSEFSTCGAQILGIPTSGPGSPTDEVNRRLSALADTAGLVDSIGDLRKNRNALDIIRAAQIPVAPKKGSATRAQTSIDLVLDRYQTEDFDPKVVRRDGVILEPVVSLQALGKLNEFDDLADGNIISKYDGGQIGKDLVPAFSAGLRSVYVSIPDAGAVKISRVGGEISDEERSGLLRSFATGISRSADLPDPSDAVRAFADASDGRFTVEFGTLTDTGFSVEENKNELIRVSTAGGKTLTVPRWVYETFLSRSAPRRAKDAPIFEVVSEDSDKKSTSVFSISSKTVMFDALSSEEVIVAHGAYVRNVKMKANAFALSTSLDEKALGRRIGRGGRAVGGRSTALFDPGINRYRCPPGTRYGGRITDQFGRNCGYSLPRSIVSSLVDFGQRLDESLDRRDSRRRDRRFGPGLNPTTSKRLNEATSEIDDVVAQFNSVFEKTEGTQAGRLGRTVGEARVSTDLTPEERELLEGNSLAAALENLRDILNDQDFENADLDAIRKAYRAVEKAANVEAGRQTDNPPRTPEQRSLAQRILDFLKEVLFRLLGIWNPDEDRRGAGADVTPGDEGAPGARPRVPGGGGGRPRVPGGRPRIPVDDDQRRPRVPGGRVDDATRDRIAREVREMSDEELLRMRGPAAVDGNTLNALRQMEIENEIRRRGLDDRIFDLGNDMLVPDLEDFNDPDVLLDALNEFRDRAEEYEVAGGGRTQEFLETLDDNDLNRYIAAFESAVRQFADDPEFDDLNSGLERLIAERDRRNKVRDSVGRGRDRINLDDPDGLADAIEEFDRRAEEYQVRGGGRTQEFVEVLSDEDLDLYIDAFERAYDIFEEGEERNAVQDAVSRLYRERERRNAANTRTSDNVKRTLDELYDRMEAYEVAGGGRTQDFVETLSDDDLIKFKNALSRADKMPDDFNTRERAQFSELKDRLDAEFNRRFTGSGRRPVDHPEGRNPDEKFDIVDGAERERALQELYDRMEAFEVRGGGMTQDFVESLNDRDLAFYEALLIGKREDFNNPDDRERYDALTEMINRFAAERERRGENFDWGRDSRPDERSMRNVNNRFPRNGLPERAYWRDEDYNGDDKAELDRRFGRYYDENNNLNQRGRFVNDQLRGDRAEQRDATPEVSPDDPDRLSRFDDAELMRQVAENDLQFDPSRISDDDLERLLNVIDANDPDLMRRFGEADDRGQERDFPALLRIVQEENAGMNDQRNPDRLPDAGAAAQDTPNIPEPIEDADFGIIARRLMFDPNNVVADANDEQLENLRGAMQRELADLTQFWRNELGLDSGEGFTIRDIRLAALGESDTDRRRLLESRLRDFRELNEAQRRFNAGEDTREVVRTHALRLSDSRRDGILGLADNGDAVVPEAAPEANVGGRINPERVAAVQRLDDLRRAAGEDFVRYADNLMPMRIYEDLDVLNAVEDAGGNLSGIDLNLRDALIGRLRQLDRNANPDAADLAVIIGNIEDDRLPLLRRELMEIRARRLRNPEGGNPPSRAMIAQAERLEAELERRRNNRNPREVYSDLLDRLLADDFSFPERRRDADSLPDDLDQFYDDLVADLDPDVWNDDVVAAFMDAMRNNPDWPHDTPPATVAMQINSALRRLRFNKIFERNLDLGDRSDEAIRRDIADLDQRAGWAFDDNERANIERMARLLRNELTRRSLGADTRAMFDADVNNQLGGPNNVEDLLQNGDFDFVRNYFSRTGIETNSNAALLKGLDIVENNDNLTSAEKAAISGDIRKVLEARRPYGSLELDRPLSLRSDDALRRHSQYLAENMDDAPEADRVFMQSIKAAVDRELQRRGAVSAVSDASASNPNLSSRLRSAISKYNWKDRWEQRLDERRSRLRKLARSRYGDAKPYEVGGYAALSGKSDAEVTDVIRQTFSHDVEMDVGEVIVNGARLKKIVKPEVTRVRIQRDDDGNIEEISVIGRNRFILRPFDATDDSMDNVTDGVEGSYTNGGFQRSFFFVDPDDGTPLDEPYVYHDTLGFKFTVDLAGNSVQFSGGGAATEFNNNALLWYNGMGIKKYRVSAASDGRAVWARHGYRATSQDSIRWLNNDMSKLLDNYRGYESAIATGVTPTEDQYMAKAIVKDAIRADRLDSMLRAHREGADIGEMPGHHDFIVALDGPNGERNGMAFRAFTGSSMNNAPIGTNTGSLTQEEVDALNNENPDILESVNATNRFSPISATFNGGEYDVEQVFTSGWDQSSAPMAGGDFNGDVFEAAGISDRWRLNPNRRPLVPGDMRNGPLDPVPVGHNGITSESDAVQRMAEGADLMDIPDHFVAQAIFANSNHPRNPNVPDSPRFTSLGNVRAGINNRQNEGGEIPGGMTMFRDNVTGQIYGFKGYGGLSFGELEAACEIEGRMLQERLGLAAGQIRWDGEMPATRPPRQQRLSGHTRGIVVELAHNYLPEEALDPNNTGRFSDANDFFERQGITDFETDAQLELLINDGDLDDVASMALLDLLTGNPDRHNSNYGMYTDPDTGKIRLVAFDNSLGIMGANEGIHQLFLDAGEDDPEGMLRNAAEVNGYSPVSGAMAELVRTDREAARAVVTNALQRLADAEAARSLMEDRLKMEREADMNLSNNPSWVEAQRMLDARYGWLTEQLSTGNIDAVLDILATIYM